MLKKLTTLAAAAILAAAPASADEGMWMLPLLKKMNIDAMHATGLQLTAEDIYSINSTSLKDAIVHFGAGCTGEIISPEGLLVTNHHCGYADIQKLSSVEHDYLKDGYWAMNRSEELPCEGLTVTFLESMTDITAECAKAAAEARKKGSDAEKAVKKYTDKLVRKTKKANPMCNVEVKTFYNGNATYLIVSKTYKDIRFVGAPPSSIGKFGADTDNWMWPRHTGDFSMFRIYADKDNNPAEYSEDNVPYRAERHLSISLKGVSEGDYTMIIGYPGTTNRYMASSELEMTRDITNAISIYVRGERQKLMMEDMLADPKVKIQYASKYARSSNGWKKWIGMNQSFAKLGIIERKKAEEAEFAKWVAQDPERTARYGDALARIEEAVRKMEEYTYINRYYSETISNIEILRAVYNLFEGKSMEEMEAFYKDFSYSTDKKIAERMIDIYKEKVPQEYQPEMFQSMSTRELVDKLYSESAFLNLESIKADIERNEGKELADVFRQDIAMKLLVQTSQIIRPVYKELGKLESALAQAKKDYTAGLLEMREGEAIYPDANSTMRLTYGTVKPYSPRDAVIYNYYTTLDGVMEKEDPDNWEFTVPQKLKDLYKAQDYGRYGMTVDGKLKMPVAFLSNNDITGGNSGSPIMNSRGELIGLAFDGNWESMSSDIMFEPDLQRCINVDIRYVLFIVDKFGGAGYLLDEMTIIE